MRTFKRVLNLAIWIAQNCKREFTSTEIKEEFEIYQDFEDSMSSHRMLLRDLDWLVYAGVLSKSGNHKRDVTFKWIASNRWRI